MYTKIILMNSCFFFQSSSWFLFLSLLETAYFTSERSTQWTCSSKIMVPQFLYCQYVYMHVCMYVPTLQPTLFELASWNLNQEVYMLLSENDFFLFWNFHFYAFYRHFSIFFLYNTSKFLVSSYWSQFFT